MRALCVYVFRHRVVATVETVVSSSNFLCLGASFFLNGEKYTQNHYKIVLYPFLSASSSYSSHPKRSNLTFLVRVLSRALDERRPLSLLCCCRLLLRSLRLLLRSISSSLSPVPCSTSYLASASANLPKCAVPAEVSRREVLRCREEVGA